VSGAQYLGGLGLELWKLGLLARWASDALLRYAGEAPLRAITGDARRLRALRDASPIAPPTATIDDVLAELVKHRAEIDEQLSRTDAATRSHLEDELARRLALPRTEPAPAQKFVLNPRSECIHRAASHGTAVPPTAWRTQCGWRFAFSAHSLTCDLKGIMWWQVCSICCPSERAALRLTQLCPDPDSD
jgi:hypothetical protein